MGASGETMATPPDRHFEAFLQFFSSSNWKTDYPSQRTRNKTAMVKTPEEPK